MNENDEIGKRIRVIRRMIGITRQNLSAKYDIEYATISLWETGKISISDKIIHQCVQMFLKEGADCSFDWIRFEKGDQPKLISSNHSHVEYFHQKDFMLPEIQFFLDVESYQINNKDAIIHQLKNKAMAPILNVGDVVGGKVLNRPEDIIKAHGKMCILSIEEEKYMVRHFYIRKNKYILTAENTTAEVINPYVLKERPIIIAPINFFRKSPIEDS